MSVRSYIGVGKLRGVAFGAAAAMLALGNASVLKVSNDLTEFDIPDYERGGGGLARKIVRVKGSAATIKLHNITHENWALALGGVVVPVTGGTATAEAHIGYQGGLIQTAHPPSAITSVTSDPTGTTYVAGTDYVLSPGGVEITEGSAIDADPVLVTYTYPAYKRVEALTALGTELHLFFEGLNDAEGGTAALVDLWRVYIPPAKALELITEKPLEIDLECTLLADHTRGTGLSKYYRSRHV